MIKNAFIFPTVKSYRLIAQTSKSGFFGLKELQQFIHNNLDYYINSRIDENIILDFSKVKIWDISGLLWLVIALHYYKNKGLSFLLQLPSGKDSDNIKEKNLDRKSTRLNSSH